jgi:hypothetical protein
MATTSFVIGKGTKVTIALPPLGSRVTPVEANLTTTNAVTPKDVDGAAGIILSAAIGAGILIPAGAYVNAKDQATGKEVLVQLKDDAKEGDANLSVISIPEPIAAGSVINYPLKLRGREAANLGRQGQRVSSVDFDSDGYSDGQTVSIEQTISVPGSWLPLDAGFATAEWAFNELREVYIWLELPRISAAYAKGRVYHGPASINNLPLDINAAGVIKGNIELTFNGKPNYDPDKPV